MSCSSILSLYLLVFQENEAFKKYNEALALSREKQYDETKRILIDVLKTPCLEEVHI